MVKNKRGQITKELVYTILFIVLLVTLVIILSFFTDKGKALLDSVKNILRFGR